MVGLVGLWRLSSCHPVSPRVTPLTLFACFSAKLTDNIVTAVQHPRSSPGIDNTVVWSRNAYNILIGFALMTRVPAQVFQPSATCRDLPTRLQPTFSHPVPLRRRAATFQCHLPVCDFNTSLESRNRTPAPLISTAHGLIENTDGVRHRITPAFHYARREIYNRYLYDRNSFVVKDDIDCFNILPLVMGMSYTPAKEKILK